MLNEKVLAQLTDYIDTYLNESVLVMCDESSEIISNVYESPRLLDLDAYTETHHKHIFQDILFNFIDQKNMNDTDVYKKSWIDRKHFSKI